VNLNQTELPDGWLWAKIEQLGEIVTGSTPSKKNPAFFGESIPFYKPTDLDVGYEVIDAREYLSELGANQSRLLPALSVLVTCIGTIGKTGLARKSCATNQQINAVILSEPYISPHWFFWIISSPQGQRMIIENASATTISIINKKRFSELTLPVPPLNEQRRIVAKIEALKARSRRVKEELEAIAPLLDQFRQSVLAAAFRGDLTADWREKNPDVETASELLMRIQIKRKKQYEEESEKANDSQSKKPIKPTIVSLDISSVQKNKSDDLPPTWVRVKLDALLPVGGIFDGPFGSNLKTSDYTDSGIRVIRLENIGRLQFIEEKRAYISNEKYLLLKKHSVYAGDILFSSFASDSVRVCILPQLTTPAIAKADCFCLRPDSDIIDRKYLVLQFSNQAFFEQLQNFTHGATRLRVNTTQLKQSEIYLCSLAEQQEIIHRVETFFKVADCIKQQYQEAQAYLDKLDQSILAKAFRGELVPQDPNDEPASVLLERIRAEREKLDTNKKAKGKTENKSRKAKPEPEPKQLSFPGFE
jgi:type I restriction enzyme S subunit